MTPPLVVAHRAGNAITGPAAAVGVADVVEADVHLFRGRLEVRHEKTLGPLEVYWERWRVVRPPPPRLLLGDLLEAVPRGVELMLDLKGPDPRLPRAVLAATRRWRDTRPLLVSSRAWWNLAPFRDVPGVTAHHSLASRTELAVLLRLFPPAGLAGLCVRRDLLTPRVTRRLLRLAPRLWTWPVDDARDAQLLAGWGVTGLICDHPEALGGAPGVRTRTAPR